MDRRPTSRLSIHSCIFSTMVGSFLSYLHLSLIGVISFFLIAFLIELKWISNQPRSKTGLAMLMLGFVITELLLVSGGLGAFYDQDILISGSASMAVGVLLLAATTTPHQVSQ